MSWIFFIIICLYAVLIGEFAVAYWRLPNYIPKAQTTHAGLSIIIPFRNEAPNLPQLLQAIAQLHYPQNHFEVLFVNDNSQDKSVVLVQEFIQSHPQLSLRCLNSVRTSGSPKKDALTLGIQHAKHPWIVTTDADCTFPSLWLQTINSFIQDTHPKMIAGPVAISQGVPSGFKHAFEQLDNLSLLGATLGGFGIKMPFMCNGAHLIYEKSAFMEQDGFKNNTHIASGDDHFLLEKFVAAYPKQVHYLKSPQAIVTTQAQHNWKGIISQRVRWASKASSYTFWFAKMVGIIVALANLITAVLLVIFVVGWCSALWDMDTAFAKAVSQEILLLALLFKWGVDAVLIARTARFVKRKKYLKWYPLVMLYYPFMSTYIAVTSLFSSYDWKGRQFSK